MAVTRATWEAELGWDADDASDTLVKSLERGGWEVVPLPGEGLYAFIGPEDALKIVLTPLPDRELGGLMRVKRCRMAAAATGTPAHIEKCKEAVRLALLRGGG